MMAATPLKRVTGPACPRCGCEDSVALAPALRWGRPTTTQQRRCKFCGAKFMGAIEAEEQDEEPKARKNGRNR